MAAGNFIFRIGGYLYRLATAVLLGPVGFGILNLAVPLQGILIQVASGGMPPAIAKYVSEYSAKDDEAMVKQVIHTSMKMVIILGLLFSVVIFFLAEPLAVGLFHKPEAILPFQLVALITPFSVIVGALRGSFQGVYQMGNIVITKAFEQVFMITSAIILIYVGFYVAGAIIGTAIGFLASALAGYYLYRRGLGKKLKNVKLNFTTKEEMAIAKMLLIFAFPVVITGLAELALFDFVGNFVVGIYMASEYVGYYGAATPIARLPLIISMAVATTVLPAAAEAAGLNNRNLLKNYLNQSFRYVTLLVLPMSVGIMIFAAPIMKLLYILPAYMNGAGALQILAMGMMFFTIYTVSSSIAQGLGKPYLPMYILIVGSLIDVALNLYLVPIYGINGAAIATTITALLIMVVIVKKTLQISEVNLHYKDLGRIVLATGIMGGLLLLVPQSLFFMPFPLNYLLFFGVMILAGIIYMAALIVVGGLQNSDIKALRKINTKSGPLKKKLEKVISLIERFAH